MRFFKDLFTGKDNQTWDLGRLLWGIGVLIFFGLSVYSVIEPEAIFDAVNWSLGFGSVMALGGVAIKIKESTEPDPKD